MMKFGRWLSQEAGASAVVIALSMLLLMGAAAIVIDLGAGFNERSQDQSAADAGVMAGALDAISNTPTMRDQALQYVRQNLDSTYSDAEWQNIWEACTDPNKNAGGYSFTAVPSPWTPGTDLDCMSVDPAGFLRVRVPSQTVDTSFGRVLGANEISTSAAAIARIVSGAGNAGILPFGLLSTATEGEFSCLRDNSGGQAKPPCDGPNTGNFGAIESPWFGTRPGSATYGSPNCNGSPKKNVLAVNIAEGLDHQIAIDADGAGGSEVLDQCSAPPFFPDTLNTFQGLSQGFEEGLVSGPVPFSATPRLQRSPSAWEASVFGWNLDDKPLWEFINPSLDPLTDDIPDSCDPDSFDDSLFDWDEDGTDDPNKSWQHISACLQDYVSESRSAVLFLDQPDNPFLSLSSRFAYVPQFWESTWPPGNSQWRHVKAFRAVFVQTLWFGTGSDNKIRIFNPSEDCIKASGDSCDYSDNPGALRQMAAFVIPDDALPVHLRGSSVGGGSLDPFTPELYR